MAFCSMCGEELDDIDLTNDFTYRKKIGYGSVHDFEEVNIRLCCDCFDKVIDNIAAHCKEDIFTDWY